MDNESYGQHIIFIIILICILFLSYCSLPSTRTLELEHKISKKALTINPTHKDSEKKTVQDEPIEPIVKKLEEAKPDTVKAPSEESPTLSGTTNVKEQKVETTVENGKRTAQIDVIPMNNPLYKTHKKGIIQFTHKKHVEEYLIACGRCHHDETGKPLDLTYDDNPRGCIECHKGTQKPKGEKLGKKEKIAKYHFEALHANCIGCHKDYNKEKGDAKGKGPAPTSCTKCHPKK